MLFSKSQNPSVLPLMTTIKGCNIYKVWDVLGHFLNVLI